MARFKYEIPPEGPLDAEIAIVAEKPAEEESRQGRLLCGATGRMARRHAAAAGLSAGREIWEPGPDGRRRFADLTPSTGVFLTNAVQSYNDPYANPTIQDVIREQPRLYRELARLRNLKCIIALGNYALAALGNFYYGNVGKDGEPTGIMQYRGSVLATPLGIKMVPTLHPSFYVRGEWRFRSIVQFDFNRAARESQYREIKRREREFLIAPTFKEAMTWMDRMAEGEWLEHDIETFQWPRKKVHPATGRRVDSGIWYISCIGFSNDPSVACCIPITRANRQPYWSRDEEAAIWRKFQWLLSRPHKNICGQNTLFDLWHERKHGLLCLGASKSGGADSMYMHRLRAPDLPHDLGFLTSIYTDEPYYKDESGKWESDITVPERQFWQYNCKDVAIGLEVTQAITRELKALDMWEYYRDYMHPQLDVLLDMQVRGMRIDISKLASLRRECEREIKAHEEVLERTEGFVPNTKSAIDMQRLLDKYNIKYSVTEKTQRPKISEELLLTYAHNYPEARPSIVRCVGITQQRTLLSNFLYPALDSCGYYHPSYDLSHAKNGRLSSSGADEGGPQAQNLPGNCRAMVIADDEECELIKADLAQADNRVVVWDAQDEFAIECFQRGLNMHRVRGCIIFRNWQPGPGLVPPSDLLDSIEKRCLECVAAGVQDCAHTQYFISKQAGHAFNYGMGVDKWITVQLPPFGVWLEKAEASRIKSLVVTQAIINWQQDTWNSMCQSPWLSSPCGRKREFYGYEGAKPSQKIYRDALSWKGSCPVAHVTNVAMVRLHTRLTSLPKARVVTQTHDSVLVNARKQDRDEATRLIKEAFHYPLYFHGRELLIPVEIGYGPNWAEAH